VSAQPGPLLSFFCAFVPTVSQIWAWGGVGSAAAVEMEKVVAESRGGGVGGGTRQRGALSVCRAAD
jgi:hypothetical protein